jgi:hypothetical protein
MTDSSRMKAKNRTKEALYYKIFRLFFPIEMCKQTHSFDILGFTFMDRNEKTNVELNEQILIDQLTSEKLCSMLNPTKISLLSC